MEPELWSLYGQMLKCRLFEEAIAKLWHDGLISGEMHLGTGEEAIIAGIVTQLREGDAMALDHRGTSALLMRGVDPVLILRELLGLPGGLCAGMGGHMHLFSKDHLAASSGIVGAAGPTAAGFALAAQYLRSGAVAIAFFGDGAMNQGMLMESMNLAAVWQLPIIFVCKDDGWGITTATATVMGADLIDRARGLGVFTCEVDGRDISEMWQAANKAIARARAGAGPTFIKAQCVHIEAHFLGYQLLRVVRKPISEMPEIAIPLTKSFLHLGGASVRERLIGLKEVLVALLTTLRDPRQKSDNDPVFLARKALLSDRIRLEKLENEIEEEINYLLGLALAEEPA